MLVNIFSTRCWWPELSLCYGPQLAMPFLIGRLHWLTISSQLDPGMVFNRPTVCLVFHQCGKKGHCSVEDARATLDVYKLVENEMERELWGRTGKGDGLPQPGPVSIDHYMQDQYWPDHLTDDSQ